MTIRIPKAAVLAILVAMAAALAVALSHSQSNAASSDYPDGHVFDYAEAHPANFQVPVGIDGNNGSSKLWIQGNPITYDGNTRVCIDVYAPAIEPDFGQSIVLNIYEGTADLGRIIDASTGQSVGSRDANSGSGTFCFYPSPGTHTYSVRAWSTGGTPSGNGLYSGYGGASQWDPSFMEIVKQSAPGT